MRTGRDPMVGTEYGHRWAIFLPNLGGGGAERVTLNLARGLLASGQAVDLVLAEVSGAYLDLVPDGARVVDLGGRRTLASLPALVRYLSRERPSGLLGVMNHVSIVAVWAATLARYRGPVLVAEHNELPAPDGSLRQRFFNWLLRWSYGRASKVIAVSEGVKRSLVTRAGVAADAIQVIYNPVIGASLQRSDYARPSLLDQGGPPWILGVGRLTRQKNFPNLLRAFASLRRVREARLVILGEGEDRASLEALVRELGLEQDVSLPGFVQNAYDYLKHADLFVLSSDWEGLPTVLIEAMALGTAVVSTDCPSGPREILADGAFGRLVPIDDTEALAAAMATSLDEKVPVKVPPGWLEQFTERAAALRYLQAFGQTHADVRG